jgi:hypothetical protein
MPDSDFDTQNLAPTMRHSDPAPPTPQQIEDRTQRCGDRCLIAGIILLAATIVATLAIVATDPTPFHENPTRSFALLSLVMFTALASVLIGAGFYERWGRSSRAATLQASKIATQNAGRLDDGERLMETLQRMLSQVLVQQQDQGGLMKDLTADILDRLQTQDERQNRTDQAIITIAEKMPDLLMSEHWKGFNEAVKEGFLEQTGTDGATARNRKHLGVVPKNTNQPD